MHEGMVVKHLMPFCTHIMLILQENIWKSHENLQKSLFLDQWDYKSSINKIWILQRILLFVDMKPKGYAAAKTEPVEFQAMLVTSIWK